MSNLPLEHHHLNTHARHREKSLTALLWTARFRWTAAGIVDQLLGGNGLARQLIKRKLLVEHSISNPFSPVRYYVTLSNEGLELLHRCWPAIIRGEHGPVALSLSSGWSLPARPEHRIREARFEHDLQVQSLLARNFREGEQIESIRLADDLERAPLDKRPSKIPDIIIDFAADHAKGEDTKYTLWGEIEYSRKNQREIDMFCAYYLGALAGISECKFDGFNMFCHESVLAQWRRDFGRAIVPKWHFRKATRDWVRLYPKDWYHFPSFSPEEINAIIRPLPSAPKKQAKHRRGREGGLAASGQPSL